MFTIISLSGYNGNRRLINWRGCYHSRQEAIRYTALRSLRSRFTTFIQFQKRTRLLNTRFALRTILGENQLLIMLIIKRIYNIISH